MSAAPTPWPSLPYDEIRPTAAFLHRISQIAGKYTLGEPFEPNWGNVLMPITARGFATPTLHEDGVFFSVEYELLDDRVTITASTGRASIPLESGSVAGFYARFVEAAGLLGIPPLPNTSQPEIEGAPPLDEDTEQREYDPDAARRIWSALAHAQWALLDYQAPFAGHRQRVGLMWGGFDVSATRFSGRSVTPPDTHPTFLRNGMTGEVVAVGFVFGDEMHSPAPAFYAYISPPPDGLEDASFGVPEAAWMPDAGLIVLPYDAVRASDDPHATVVRFADAVYAVAVERGGWPAELAGRRFEGWYACSHPVFG
jgi:hypothetical protein